MPLQSGHGRLSCTKSKIKNRFSGDISSRISQGRLKLVVPIDLQSHHGEIGLSVQVELSGEVLLSTAGAPSDRLGVADGLLRERFD
jgi:hypothetical protein